MSQPPPGSAVRVFLTGASGFIGSHLARLLVDGGCQVTALVRPGADPRRLAEAAPRIRFVEGDLFAPRALEAPLIAARPELCFHLAWYAGPDHYLHAPENLDCVAGTLGLLQGLDAAGCRRVVLTGTCIEYDTDAGYLSEDSPTRPRSLYAACKQALWAMAERFARDRGWTCAWARVFHPYGPWEPEGRLIPSVIRALLAGRPCPLTEGRQIRDFVHVEDVASAFWTIAARGLVGPVNIGASRPASVATVAETIGRVLGRPDLLRLGALPVPEGDPACVCAQPGRLRTEGWVPRYDLEAGLRDTIAWWRERRA